MPQQAANEEEAYENETWNTLSRGWAPSKFTPPHWSNKEGTDSRDLDEIQPKAGWEWASNWKIDTSVGDQRRGWEYASRFDRFNVVDRPIRSNKNWSDKVRRRKWVRAVAQKRRRPPPRVSQGSERSQNRGFNPSVGATEIAQAMHRIDHAIAGIRHHVHLIGGSDDCLCLRQQLQQERTMLRQLITQAQAKMQEIGRHVEQASDSNSRQGRKRQPQTAPLLSRAQWSKLNRELKSLKDKYDAVNQSAVLKERTTPLSTAATRSRKSRTADTGASAAAQGKGHGESGAGAGGYASASGAEPDAEAQLVQETLSQMQVKDWVDINSKLIEEREEGLHEVASGISEIHQMYQEFSGMVSDQQAGIDAIEAHAGNAQKGVEAGLKEVHQANDYQQECSVM